MGASLSTLLIRYTGASVVQVFFITAASFGALSPVGLHHEPQPVRHGLVPDHGPRRPDHRLDRQHLRGVEHAAVRHLGDRRADLRRPDRLRHAEAEGDVPLRQFRHRGRREGLGVRRADAVSGLHQHVPVPPRARSATATSKRTELENAKAPARAGAFSFFSSSPPSAACRAPAARGQARGRASG